MSKAKSKILRQFKLIKTLAGYVCSSHEVYQVRSGHNLKYLFSLKRQDGATLAIMNHSDRFETSIHVFLESEVDKYVSRYVKLEKAAFFTIASCYAPLSFHSYC